MNYESIFANSRITRRQRVDTAIHTLEGILRGISIDGVISFKELNELKSWVEDNHCYLGNHPFSELIPKIDSALKDGVIDTEEQEDIIWLCQNLQSESIYYDEITSDIQRLHGLMHGILADGKITDEEIRNLSSWIDEQSHLKGCYPYDEIDSLLTHVLKDGQIDDSEREMLKFFFEDFVSYSMSRRIKDARSGLMPSRKISGICAVCPELVFLDRTYSFTGASTKATRNDMAAKVQRLGGIFSNSVNTKVHFLIVGAAGNPAWAYSCYGRKVEQAMRLRSDGHPIVIVHENDFWDALNDN
jgi:NAD-dependent DNA ligase